MADTVLLAPDGVTQAAFPEEKVQDAMNAGFTQVPADTSSPTGPLKGNLAPTPPSEVAQPSEATEGQPKVGTTAVRNLNTGLIEDLPVDKAEVGLIQGTHELPDPQQTVRVLDTASGQMYDMPAGNVKDAIVQTNGQVKIADIYEKEQAQLAQERAKAKEEAEQNGVTGLLPLSRDADEWYRQNFPSMFKKQEEIFNQTPEGMAQKYKPADVALAGAGNQTPLAPVMEAIHQQDIAGNPSAKAHAAGLQDYLDAHPIAYYTGAIPSVIANAFVTGEVGELATGVLGLKGLTKIATEGALYGLAPAAGDIINQNYKSAGEDIALGAVGNILAHGLFSAMEKGSSAAATAAERAATEAPEALNTEANTIWRSLGVTKPTDIETLKNYTQKLVDDGILGKGSIQDNLDRLQQLADNGPKIGKAIQELDTLPNRQAFVQQATANAEREITKLMDPRVVEQENIASQLEKAKVASREADATAKEAETSLKEADQAVKKATPKTLADAQQRFVETSIEHGEASNSAYRARALVQDLTSKLAPLTPLQKQGQAALKDVLEQVRAPHDSFADLQKTKQFIAGQTNFNVDNKFANNLRQQAYGAFRKAQVDAEDAGAKALGKPEVAQNLVESRAAYAVNRVLRNVIEKNGTKDVLTSDFNTFMGHTYHNGLLGLLAHTIVPHPLSVPVAIGARYVGNKIFGKGAQFNKAIGAFQKNTIKAMADVSEKQAIKISEGVKSVLGKGAALGAVKFAGGINNFLPNNGVGLSTDQKVEALRKAVAQAEANPELLASHLGTVTQPLIDAGLKPVAQAYSEHQVRLMKVIQSILPQDPSMQTAHPFSSNVEVSEMSDATKHRLDRALTIAAEPDKLFAMIRNNTITPMDVAIAGAVNPETLQAMRDELVNEAMKSKPDLSYQQRLSVGIFMGTNVDESTQQVPTLQGVYAPVPPMGGSTVLGTKGGSTKMGAKASEDLGSSFQTTSQKAQLQLP